MFLKNQISAVLLLWILSVSCTRENTSTTTESPVAVLTSEGESPLMSVPSLNEKDTGIAKKVSKLPPSYREYEQYGYSHKNELLEHKFRESVTVSEIDIPFATGGGLNEDYVNSFCDKDGFIWVVMRYQKAFDKGSLTYSGIRLIKIKN